MLSVSTGSINGDQLIGADPYDGEIFTMDPATGDVSNPVLLPFQRVSPEDTLYKAMARHPVTDLCYVLVGDSDTRPILCTLDVEDGSFTAIAPVGLHKTPGGSPSIAFGPAPDYTLYLITGGSGSNYSTSPGSIYTVDITTAAATPSGWTTQGNGAHAIEYNPDDGFLYHFYYTGGGGGGPGLEKFNLTTGAATPVPLSGTVFNKVNGVAYLGGLFYVMDSDAKTVYSVTSGGVVTAGGGVPDFIRALATDGTGIFGLTEGTGAALYEIDPVAGGYTQSIALGSVPEYRSMNSLARDPVSGALYGLAHPDYPADRKPTLLVQIDPLSGKFSNPVNLTVNNLDEIAFDSVGNLYGVAGISAMTPLPGELAGGTIASIDPGTGIVSAETWNTTKNFLAAKSIAFNPDNGLLYYLTREESSADLIMETIDPSTGTVSSIGTILAGVNHGAQAMTYDPAAGVFYFHYGFFFYSVTPGGVVTLISDVFNFPYAPVGLAMIPPLKINSFDLSETGAVLTWDSVINREYGIYSNPDLENWSPVPGFTSVSATAPLNTATNVPLPTPQTGFFRLGPPSGE